MTVQEDRDSVVTGFESEIRGVLGRHSMLVTSNIPVDVGARFVRRIVEALDDVLIETEEHRAEQKKMFSERG